MSPRQLSFALATLVLVASRARAQQPQSASPSGGKQMAAADLKGWRSIRSPVLSNDGKWFAYLLAPNEGDATVVVRQTADGATEQRLAIGELPAGAANPFGGATVPATLAISGDSRYLAFTVYPTEREARRLRQQHRPEQNKLAVLNLATGKKTEFEKIRRFAFSGERPKVIALYRYPPDSPASGAGTESPRGAASTAAHGEGADLLLYSLVSGSIINIGNVGEFAFDESGSYLAYTIDARDRVGNGVQLRDLRTDVVRPLDGEQSRYRHLVWADSGPALAVLRGRPDSAARDTTYSVVAFTGIGTAAEKTIAFDPVGRSDFPAGMVVSADRAPWIADDFGTVFFGIRLSTPRADMVAGRDDAASRTSIVQAGAPGNGGTRNQPRVDRDDETPTLVLWHWKDPRLQSQQLVQEQQDRTYSYLSEYRFAENRFVRLSDDALRQVTLLPHDRYAYGIDTRGYDQQASYDGRRYADIYAAAPGLRVGQGRERRTPERRLGRVEGAGDRCREGGEPHR